MKDKLTKKRIKVDYLLVIKIANRELDFLKWQQSHTSKISFNRKAYAFCKHNKIDVDSIFGLCLERGIQTLDQYQKELTRIAHTPWLED